LPTTIESERLLLVQESTLTNSPGSHLEPTSRLAKITVKREPTKADALSVTRQSTTLARSLHLPSTMLTDTSLARNMATLPRAKWSKYFSFKVSFSDRKTEGISYLSDSVYKGIATPGPTAYNPDSSCIQANTRGSVSMRVPSKGLEKPTWRHAKSNKPDMGSYEIDKAASKMSQRKSSPAVKFSTTKLDRYTTQYAKSKAFVPGAGNYEHEKCFKQLSRPPSASRRMR